MDSIYRLKPVDELLLSCAIIDMDHKTKSSIESIVKSGLDWNYLLFMAKRHNLTSLLYWQLNRIGDEKVPSNVMEELQENFHINVMKNLAMFKELIRVIETLNKEGINAIPYKGPVLAIMAYKNLGLREFSDLDFYVPIKDVPMVKEILINNDYDFSMKLTDNQEKVFFNLQREYQFTNKSSNVAVEIQWKFLSRIFSISNEFFFIDSNFWENVYLDQHIVKTLSSEPLILLLSIHNASHFFPSLSRFQDISELIRSEKKINWAYIIKKAEEIDAKRILLVNLCIVKQLFGIKLPKEITVEINNNKTINKISQRIISYLFSSKSSWGLIEKCILQFSLREQLTTKIKTIINLIFWPTPEVIQSFSLPVILQPFYYLLQFSRTLKNLIIKK